MCKSYKNILVIYRNKLNGLEKPTEIDGLLSFVCGTKKNCSEIIASISAIEQFMEQKLRVCCEWTSENAEMNLPQSA